MSMNLLSVTLIGRLGTLTVVAGVIVSVDGLVTTADIALVVTDL